jgi:hypothetical protein
MDQHSFIKVVETKMPTKPRAKKPRIKTTAYKTNMSSSLYFMYKKQQLTSLQNYYYTNQALAKPPL